MDSIVLLRIQGRQIPRVVVPPIVILVMDVAFTPQVLDLALREGG